MIETLAALALLSSAASPAAKFTYEAPAGDPAASTLGAESDASRRAIEHFFGRRYVHPVRVTIVGSRKEFDAALPAAWGIAPSQCWMVGAGVYDRLIMLSPTAWSKEACDHKPGDVEEAKSIMRHELTHVFHGQHNPTHDFTGMDDAGWFVEGLATYVSGQLTDKRLARAQAALQARQGPKTLADAWSGKEKYGFSGSMLAYVEEKYGRAKLVSLLGKTSNAAMLKTLRTTEADFLAAWSAWLKARKVPPVSSR